MLHTHSDVHHITKLQRCSFSLCHCLQPASLLTEWMRPSHMTKLLPLLGSISHLWSLNLILDVFENYATISSKRYVAYRAPRATNMVEKVWWWQGNSMPCSQLLPSAFLSIQAMLLSMCTLSLQANLLTAYSLWSHCCNHFLGFCKIVVSLPILASLASWR